MKKQLPKNWVEVQLIDILEVLENGSRPKGGVQGILEGVPSIGGEHLDSNGGFKFGNLKYVPTSFAEKMKRGLIKENDILIVKDGATTGKTSYINNSFPFDLAFVNEHVFICRTFSNLNSKSIFYFLFSRTGFDSIMENFTGSAQGGINQKFASNTLIPLPPIKEQNRIVEKLDHLFIQLEIIKTSMANIPLLLKDFRQQVLTQAVTGKMTEEWRKGINLGDYKIVSIENLVNSLKTDIRTGPFGSSLKKEEHKNEGIPVWGIESIGLNGKFTGFNKIFVSKEKAEKLKSFEVKGGNIIISRSGTVGELCILPDDVEYGLISTNLMKIILNNKNILSKYFCWLFKGSPVVINKLNDLCKGSTRLFLTQTILKNLDFPLPPIEEQQEIVSRVESLFAKADAIEQQYNSLKQKIDTLPQALLHKAFKGELSEQLDSDGDARELLKQIQALKNTKVTKPKAYKVPKEKLRMVAETK
ncbi:MAG TPA: restriction endonuclease subunit S [Lutibacter sp.]